jgi:putative membrane-bound dehydrogenase-like protein
LSWIRLKLNARLFTVFAFPVSGFIMIKSVCIGLLLLSTVMLEPQGTSSPEQTPSAPAKNRLALLFLGDNGHHQPRLRFAQLQPVLAARGIDLTYTDEPNDLKSETLAKYDGLLLYANIDAITPEQEKSLLRYVEAGGGFIPLHCASYCFRNSSQVVGLIGAQFQSHGTGTFRTEQAEVDHPILKGFQSFSSWDETYVHTKHNENNRVVLEYRVEGAKKEPWTWVRTHGKGRVFYTAWGHDERTWGHPGFQNLVERGIRWAVGADVGVAPEYRDAPHMTAKRTDVKPFEYVAAKVPFYPPSKVWGVTAEPFTKMQKPLPPEESRKHCVHPDNFELKLFASEPLIQAKPICMNWDEQGRLWIAETVDYPNDKLPSSPRDGTGPRGLTRGHDRIVILEDTDGDGVADKRTVFAEGLNIPTSIAFAQGGVIVHQAPHTLFFKNENDKAGTPQILFSGWGTQDTHAGPSNLQYGLDGWFYGAVGYSGFDGTVGNQRIRFGQGFYRFKVDAASSTVTAEQKTSPIASEAAHTVSVSKLEFLASTNNNTWGLGFSEEGILFGSTANGNPSVCCPIPNRYYERVKGWSPTVLPSISGNAPMFPITENVRQVDYHGHFTAAAGHALYTARLYPMEYWNRVAFVCEPTGHLVACFELTPDGASFRSRNAWNLLASDDEWASPIMAEVGPDSCVWILDWYNYIVQHNPTPAGYQTGKGNAYEIDLRDKTHGRVYRLVPKGMKLPAAVTLKNASPEHLVATLKHENKFWRMQAQRLLVESENKEQLRVLVKLSRKTQNDALSTSVEKMHAFCIMVQLMGQYCPQAFPKENRNSKWVELCGMLLMADEPSTLPQETAAMLMKSLLQSARKNGLLEDRWLRDAFIAASAKMVVPALSALCDEQEPLPPPWESVVKILATHYARSGEFDQFQGLLKKLTTANAPVQKTILDAWATAWPRTALKFEEENKQHLLTLLRRISPESRGAAIKLGMLWAPEVVLPQARALKKTLEQKLANANLSESDRLNAAREMVVLLPQDDQVAEQVVAAITPRLSTNLTAALLQTLAETRTKNLAAVLLPRLKELAPAARAEAIKLLLTRPESTRALLEAFQHGEVQVTELSLEQRQALANHPNSTIAVKAKEIIARGGGLPSADRQKVIDAWLPLTRKTGDAFKGKLVFTQHCGKCHQHSGEGKTIGPDLTGMAVHSKEELIIHILDPSRSVEGNFRIYTVVMQDGKVHSGMLAAESRTSVELIDTEGKSTTLQREEIDQLAATNKSLMPEGFEKQMNEGDFTNLLEFLTQKGKYVPLPLDQVATVTTAKGMFFGEEGTSERLIFPDWKPKTFNSVPFLLMDPQGGKVKNAVMLNGPQGQKAPHMPTAVKIACAAPVKTLHFLSGISGWGYPASEKGTVSMIVRLRYADGQTEDHPLRNGEHFADYIRRVDVPGSQFAFNLRGRQLRYLTVMPLRSVPLLEVELVKGPDGTAPVVMAVTAELR